jgi:hypothetical protein
MTTANDDEAKKAAREALIRCFAGKVCPILSVGMANAQPTGSLVMAPGASLPPQKTEGEMMGCQGPNCMWFLLTAGDDAGNATEGSCALPVLAQAEINKAIRSLPKNGSHKHGKRH